jgi:hypothetical protein
MAFAGIFQPFARLRWIRFGLLMRAVNSRAAFQNLSRDKERNAVVLMFSLLFSP